jgi:hypothetical protein
MATGNKVSGSRMGGQRRSWKSWTLLAMVVAAAALLWQWDWISGQASAATAFGAKTACSCRFVGGRDLASCQGDFVPGMEAVFVSQDVDEQSVTATVPLVSSSTAHFHDGFGCVLDSWED